jgi:acetyl-CoA C-acetyltransferase
LKAVALAAQAIRAGDADIVVAGGMESMSQAPHLLLGSRAGFRLGHAELRDANIHDGLWDVYKDFHMGMTAELVAEKHAISRDEQDRFALASHRKAAEARAAGRFAAEICPVEVPQPKGPALRVVADESIRADSTLEALARLKPAFKPAGGSVTAGNAPGLSDGAAALVVMAAEVAERRGIAPLGRILGYATGHRDPEWVMLAPVDGVRNLCAKLGLAAASDFDLVELNEAFSAAAIAVTRELGLDPARVNVHGGAVALGHPIGASGARILTTLLYGLQARDARTGLAALCLGGGGSVAVAVAAGPQR